MEQPKEPQAELAAPQKPQEPPMWRQWLLVAGVVFGAFIVLNAAIWGLYAGRAYPGVKVGGMEVSNLDQTTIQNRVKAMAQQYALQLTVRDQQTTVRPDQIGLDYDEQASARSAVNQGKQYIIPLYGLVYTWQSGAVDLRFRVDTTKLKALAVQLAGQSSIAPVDAKVVVEGEAVRVEADKPGKGIDPQQLEMLMRKQIATGGTSASMAEQQTEAKVSAKEAEAVVPALQQAMKLPLSIQVNGKLFAPGTSEIGKWLTTTADTDGKLALSINQDAINAYVAAVAGQVDVAAVNKQINMVNGEVRTVSEGKNGSALDRTGLATALATAITTGKNTALTGTMGTVAFKTRTNNSVDLNGKYIEINLSRQQLWAYDDKQLVYTTPITSGATGAGFATIQGLFSIKAKQTNRNLNGVPLGFDYNVFVNYWMPFSGNYGLHDASWRSSFGGQDYYYGGSHGCVNLPAGAAAWVYNFVNVGTPVWVHS
jgi:lipoprotein-anchoring transpeptidase ErfK/SrfK